jgi:hypothetical protein
MMEDLSNAYFRRVAGEFKRCYFWFICASSAAWISLILKILNLPLFSD